MQLVGFCSPESWITLSDWEGTAPTYCNEVELRAQDLMEQTLVVTISKMTLHLTINLMAMLDKNYIRRWYADS